MAKLDSTLALFPDATPTTDNKATAGTPTLYSDYDRVYDDFSIVVIARLEDGTVSELFVPDFMPHDFDVKTTHNHLHGGNGALQSMQSRAALFAKNPRIVEAAVRRERDKHLWFVDRLGHITESESETA